MINKLTSVLFNGQVTTLEQFLLHCREIADGNHDSSFASRVTRKDIIDQALENIGKAKLKFEHAHDDRRINGYAERANTHLRLGYEVQLHAQNLIIHRIETFMRELNLRASAGSSSPEEEFAIETLKSALKTATIPLEKPDTEIMHDAEAKVFVLKCLQEEMRLATELLGDALVVPNEELPEIVSRYEIAQSLLKPLDVVQCRPMRAPSLSISR